MYRLSISLLPSDGDYDRVSITHKRSGKRWRKRVSVHGDSVGIRALRMTKKIREVLRELLFTEFGDGYRQAEQHHMKSLNKSLASAAKRMRWTTS